MQEFNWEPIRLIDLKPGDVIAIDSLENEEESTTDVIVEIYEDQGGYTEAMVAAVSHVDHDGYTKYAVHLDDGQVLVLDEQDGCYCGCRDYHCTIKITPAA